MSKRETPLGERLGRRITELRAELGLTQEKLAWEAGLSSKGYLSRIERGERLPSVNVLERLAERLEVDVRDLFVFPDRGEVDEAIDVLRREGSALAKRVLKLARPRGRAT